MNPAPMNPAPMNSDQRVCTVAVDVGNTAVKLAVRHGNSVADRSIPIHTQAWPAEAIDWVSGQLGCQNIRWLISSVHRSATETLIRAIEDRPSQVDSVKVIHHHDIPMKVLVDDPTTLGIDRLIGAFAAVNLSHDVLANDVLASDTLESDETPARGILSRGGMVVVDAGSAITVDWVDHEGSFRGGAILPGLRLQAKSLATGTDALPEIDWNGDWKAFLPATNTRDAIFGGILLGTAGAIDSLSRHYLGQDASEIKNGGDAKIVLTGGDAAAISAHLGCPHRCLPHLVCHGLLELGIH